MNAILQDIPLKNKTSFGIGGNARFYIKIHSVNEIRNALAWSGENDHSVFFLGKGSNILISDFGWPGLVIDMSDYSKITWNSNSVESQAGAMINILVRESVERGFSGMEKLAGIPGTVGGALVMNAGAFEQNISDCLISVTGLNVSDYSEQTFQKHEMSFGYRTSFLKNKDFLILSASFRLKQGNKKLQEEIYTSILKKRIDKQPVNSLNCGSVFKRPQGNYAGSLIEKSGLKGFSIGRAVVSEKHANFIINTGDAKASDVRKLIVHIQEKVYNDSEVLLEPEVLFIGEFDTPLFIP